MLPARVGANDVLLQKPINWMLLSVTLAMSAVTLAVVKVTGILPVHIRSALVWKPGCVMLVPFQVMGGTRSVMFFIARILKRRVWLMLRKRSVALAD